MGEEEKQPPVADSVLDEARRVLSSAEAELTDLGSEIARLGLGAEAVCAVCGASVESEGRSASPGERRCARHALEA